MQITVAVEVEHIGVQLEINVLFGNGQWDSARWEDVTGSPCCQDTLNGETSVVSVDTWSKRNPIGVVTTLQILNHLILVSTKNNIIFLKLSEDLVVIPFYIIPMTMTIWTTVTSMQKQNIQTMRVFCLQKWGMSVRTIRIHILVAIHTFVKMNTRVRYFSGNKAAENLKNTDFPENLPNNTVDDAMGVTVSP